MPEYAAEQDDGNFTFPTPPPPPQMLSVATVRAYGYSCRGRVSPVQLSAPIRRSFSAVDCTGSPWRSSPRGGCSPALSDYAARYFDQLENEDEEVMDSLWEDLNDDYYDEGEPTAIAKDQREAAAVLAASRSSRRRPAGLVVMLRALKRMLVAHKSRSKVHKVDEQSAAAAAASAPPPVSSSVGKK